MSGGAGKTRRRLIWPTIALVTLVIELGAMIGTVTGDPFAPVDGWGLTHPADAATFVLVFLGCVALALFDRLPLPVAMIATASYVLLATRDHELGMFLPPMIAILALAALTRHRLSAIVCAVVSLASVWVGRRTAPIADPGVALLGWVALGSVLAVFFLVPLLIGEIIRSLRELRDVRSSQPAQPGTPEQKGTIKPPGGLAPPLRADPPSSPPRAPRP